MYNSTTSSERRRTCRTHEENLATTTIRHKNIRKHMNRKSDHVDVFEFLWVYGKRVLTRTTSQVCMKPRSESIRKTIVGANEKNRSCEEYIIRDAPSPHAPPMCAPTCCAPAINGPYAIPPHMEKLQPKNAKRHKTAERVIESRQKKKTKKGLRLPDQKKRRIQSEPSIVHWKHRVTPSLSNLCRYPAAPC